MENSVYSKQWKRFSTDRKTKNIRKISLFTAPLTSGLIERQYVTKVSADYGHLVLSDIIQESSKHIRCGMSTVFPDYFSVYF